MTANYFFLSSIFAKEFLWEIKLFKVVRTCHFFFLIFNEIWDTILYKYENCAKRRAGGDFRWNNHQNSSFLFRLHPFKVKSNIFRASPSHAPFEIWKYITRKIKFKLFLHQILCKFHLYLIIKLGCILWVSLNFQRWKGILQDA